MQLSDVIGNESLFPVRKKWKYFNHAGISPMNTRAGSVLKSCIDRWADDCIMGEDWFGKINDLRVSSAALINAEPAEIALLKNTAEGISAVAFGLDWRAGDRIVINQSEYPANQYPWLELERRFGVEVVKVPEHVADNGERHVPTDALLAALDDRVKLLSVSHVQWSTGQLMDLAPLGAACRKRGILFGIDGIQSLGVVPIDVQAAQADFLWAGCHKWQLGPMGVGIFWCRSAVMDRVKPNSVGAMTVANPMDWDTIDLNFAADAKRYECGTPNLPGYMVLLENHRLLQEVGIAEIFDHVRGLGERFDAVLVGSAWQRVTTRTNPSQILTYTHPDADLAKVLTTLQKQHHIELAVRNGRLRFSPHLHNTPEEVEAAAELLRGE